jgi:hypothetical protein
MADTEVRIEPKEAYFRLGMGMPSHRCGDCIAYQNGSCVTVAVSPSADDICRLYRPHPANGSMSAMQAGAFSMIGRSTGELSLFINRVSRDPQTGVRRWYSTASGTKRDLYNEKMSVPLFKDFIRRIEAGDKAPEPFASRAWQGGLPYLGVAHYLDMEGDAIVGTTDRVWIDADIFKARGTFSDGPLADAAFKAIQEDIRLNRPTDQRVRVSIAFVDWGHDHEGAGTFMRKSLMDRCPHCDSGAGDKVYKSGQLVHLALTRRPAYVETTIALEERSMSARRDDAASVVGDELADELERRSKVLTQKSAPAMDASAIVIREVAAPVTTEEDADEKAAAEGGDTEELAEKSFGGAQSMDEAEVFLTRSVSTSFVDAQGVLVGILKNLVGDADKAELVEKAVADYQSRLDSLAVDALVAVKDALRGRAFGEKKANPFAKEEKAPVEGETPAEETEDEMEEEVEPEVEPEEAPEGESHILDEAYASLKAAFDEAVASGGDRTTRLQMIQPALNALADAIMQNVEGGGEEAQDEQVPPQEEQAPTKEAPVKGAKPPVKGAAPADEETSDEDALAEIVRAAVAPLVQEMASFRTELASRAAPPVTPVKRQAPLVPERRALRAIVRSSVGAPTPGVVVRTQPDKGGSRLRSIARRSVGLSDE